MWLVDMTYVTRPCVLCGRVMCFVLLDDVLYLHAWVRCFCDWAMCFMWPCDVLCVAGYLDLDLVSL